MSNYPDENDPIMTAPIAFGLAAQGHISTVQGMLKEGKTWDEIGNAIGWVGSAVQRHWEWHLDAERKDVRVKENQRKMME